MAESHERDRSGSAQDLGRLAAAAGFTKPMAVRDKTALQKSEVAREQDAVLGGGNAGQFLVPEAVLVACVETKHAKIYGELAEMNIEDEFGFPQGLRPHPSDRRDVKRLKHGIRAKPVAIMNQLGKTGGCDVDKNQIDFGVWHSEAFDKILRRGRRQHWLLKRAILAAGRKMVI